jgi:hypothetical protein
MDNALDNDIILREISQWLLATHTIIWDGDKHRLHCFRHVVSLITDAFTANKPLKVLRVPRAPKGTPKAQKPIWKRPVDAILKLYEIIFFAMRILERAREWQNYTIQASDDFLYPIKDNDTR